jgi:hypothetical protein
MARGASPASLTAAEAAMMTFSRKVARGAFLVTAADVDELKRHGFTDAEVFDITATVAGRAFFSMINEALGVEPEAPLLELEPELRKALIVGRPPKNGDSTPMSLESRLANGDSPTSPARA